MLLTAFSILCIFTCQKTSSCLTIVNGQLVCGSQEKHSRTQLRTLYDSQINSENMCSISSKRILKINNKTQNHAPNWRPQKCLIIPILHETPLHPFHLPFYYVKILKQPAGLGTGYHAAFQIQLCHPYNSSCKRFPIPLCPKHLMSYLRRSMWSKLVCSLLGKHESTAAAADKHFLCQHTKNTMPLLIL